MADSQELLKQADAEFQQRKYEEATRTFERAAESAKQADNTSIRVEACAMTARGYLIRDMKDEGRGWLKQATELASPAAPAGWSRLLGVRGRFEWKEGDNARATKTFREMYDYCLQHKLHNRAVDAAHMVAITGTQAEQVEWAHKGIAAAEQGELDGWLGPLWNNLGATYDDQKNYAKALESYEKARHYHWKVGDEQAKFFADWAVAKTYRRLGKQEEAGQWLRPLLAWAERRHAQERTDERGEWVGLVCWDLGEVAVAGNDTKSAQELLSRAHQLLGAVNMQDWDPQGWKEINERLKQLKESRD